MTGEACEIIKHLNCVKDKLTKQRRSYLRSQLSYHMAQALSAHENGPEKHKTVKASC